MSISPALSKTFEEKYALNIVIVCRGRLHIGHDFAFRKHHSTVEDHFKN